MQNVRFTQLGGCSCLWQILLQNELQHEFYHSWGNYKNDDYEKGQQLCQKWTTGMIGGVSFKRRKNLVLQI